MLHKPYGAKLTTFSKSSDGYVTRVGKLFELGDYQDKQFSLNEAEADQALADLEGRVIFNDYEHLTANGRKHPLAERLGTLINAQRVGNSIEGAITVPEWLHNLYQDESGNPLPLPVSLTFDEQKRIHSVSLTGDPRISDAQVMAAFSAWSGAGAHTPKPMDDKTLLDQIKGLLGFKTHETPADPPAGPVHFHSNPADAAEIARLKAESDAKDKLIADARKAEEARDTEALRVAATNFHRELVKVHDNVTPASEAPFVDLYVSLAKADNAGKLTCFNTDGKVNEGDLLGRLIAFSKALPKVGTFSKSEGKYEAWPNGRPNGDKPSEDRLAELRGHTNTLGGGA